MRVLVTAGPTHEYIDDVRFISNPSSGQMGYAVAAAAVRRGHDVVLISGPSMLRPPRAMRVVGVVSAREMLKATLEHFGQCDCLIMTAAVGDYRPESRVFGKIKKEARDTLVLRLVRNPDILAECGRRRKRGQVLIGFALESVGDRPRSPT
ncbi:MAG: phosphopantothenoylcysteine decarboxylase, partial [Planctomycetota bacterium]|nr:phosphopantothenoylcysteine decarboxylase [Planctomycetota bacterium]